MAILVLQAVSAVVGIPQAIAVMAGSPEVVEHVLEAVEVHDALNQTP